MGLYNYTDRVHPPPGKRVVHVEFDYFVNPAWDPPYQHVGINNNSLSSAVFEQWISDPHPGHPILVEINYSSSTHNLTVSWEYGNSRTWSLWYVIDLRKVLPESVIMGFSATCNDFSGEQELLSWDFTSDLEMRESSFPKKKLMGIVALIAVIAIAANLIVYGFLNIWKKNGEVVEKEMSMTDEFSRGAGPRRFSYSDLVSATNNFSLDWKLGEGGFGSVYKGYLRDYSGTPVAVKRISKDSRQGIKEYSTEVKIISQLRHRNLVQLIGWCHDKAELLLVYQFMPNGSLDTHLFGNSDVFSFGVVCLEIATGRRVVDYIEPGLEMGFVEWVWDLYGTGKLRMAIDRRLVELDEKEIECLMVVGLWCAHPDSTQRASIRQAIQVLKFEAAFPSLPDKKPLPLFAIHVPVLASTDSLDASFDSPDEPLISCSVVES
ncbi:L-type lectin-domain containing receptor kinase IX.1 [Linum perenne]